eukprot:2640589-Pyramimonas_sp.AAC.1
MPARATCKVHSRLFLQVTVWRGAIAHSKQYAGPPTCPVKNRCKVIAGSPRMIQMFVQSAFSIVFRKG